MFLTNTALLADTEVAYFVINFGRVYGQRKLHVIVRKNNEMKCTIK